MKVQRFKFSCSAEEAKSFITGFLPPNWEELRQIIFSVDNCCNLLYRKNEQVVTFVATSTNSEFSDLIISKANEWGFKYVLVERIDDLENYDHAISKESDSRYSQNVDVVNGKYYTELIKNTYFQSYIDRHSKKLENVIKELAKYKFEYSILICLSYLEELLSQMFFSNLNSKKTKQYQKQVGSILTLSFKIEYLYARDLMDEKTYKVLNQLRKIRNLIAHNSILSEHQQKSIESRLNEILNICDNNSKFLKGTLDHTKDQRFLKIFPIIQNICTAFLGCNLLIIPERTIAKVAYANKGYGQGFNYYLDIEKINYSVYNSLWIKFSDMGLVKKDSDKFDLRIQA